MFRTGRTAFCMACALAIGGAVLAQAGGAPDGDAKAPKAVAKAADQALEVAQGKAIRLPQPWSFVTTLSDEQKARIAEIHQQTLEKIRALREEEEQQILALLSDEQKDEIERTVESRKAEAKVRAAQRKEKADDDRPSDDADEKGGKGAEKKAAKKKDSNN